MKTNLLGTNLNVIGYYFAYLSIEHNYTLFFADVELANSNQCWVSSWSFSSVEWIFHFISLRNAFLNSPVFLSFSTVHLIIWYSLLF